MGGGCRGDPRPSRNELGLIVLGSSLTGTRQLNFQASKLSTRGHPTKKTKGENPMKVEETAVIYARAYASPTERRPY
jgi:hypothetical protein